MIRKILSNKTLKIKCVLSLDCFGSVLPLFLRFRITTPLSQSALGIVVRH